MSVLERFIQIPIATELHWPFSGACGPHGCEFWDASQSLIRSLSERDWDRLAAELMYARDPKANRKSATGLPQAAHSGHWRELSVGGLLLTIRLAFVRERKSLHVLEGLLIFHTDFVDQLCVDNNPLL